MVIGTVPLFQGMTAWFVVLESHFGWSRTQLSIAFSLSRVEGSIMGPISGYLIDKLGSRRMVLIGLVIAGGGFVIMSQMQNIWHFYLAFIVMSMGVGLGTWMPMMTVLNNWFAPQPLHRDGPGHGGLPRRRHDPGAPVGLRHRPRRPPAVPDGA